MRQHAKAEFRGRQADSPRHRAFPFHFGADGRPDGQRRALYLLEAQRGEVFDLGWRAAMAGDDDVVLAPSPYSTAQPAERRAREKRLMREIDEQGIELYGRA